VARIAASPETQEPSPAAPASSAAAGALAPHERQAFLTALSRLSEHEEAFTESLYARFFALRPDAAELFGEYSISEREEMVRETFRCLLAWLEGEPWLDANLRALGRSHAEYGVEDEMYPPFVEALIESARSVTDAVPEESLDASTLALLRGAAEQIVSTMRAAGGG